MFLLNDVIGQAESWIQNLPFYPFLEKLINDTIGLPDYIDQAVTFFTGLDVVTQLLMLIVVAVIVIMGLFELIKKLSKLIIVVGVLAGLYLLYSNGALDGLIG